MSELINKYTNKHILFPWGGGGNHLRSLLLLDKNFDLCFAKLGLKRPTLDQKLAFIKDRLYPSDRTWNNWLSIEHRYRKTFDLVINIQHLEQLNIDTDSNDKFILLSFDDPNLVLNHYWHLCLDLNGNSAEVFCQTVKDWSKNVDQLSKNKNILVIKGEVLYEPILDNKFYNRVCEFFELENFFKEAFLVHRWWNEARVRSAKDFCKQEQEIQDYMYKTGTYDWLQRQEFQNYIHRMKTFAEQAEKELND